MRLTPPLRAKRRIAGFVMPWMLSLRTFLCLLAPPLPKPFPPFPRPDILIREFVEKWLSRRGVTINLYNLQCSQQALLWEFELLGGYLLFSYFKKGKSHQFENNE